LAKRTPTIARSGIYNDLRLTWARRLSQPAHFIERFYDAKRLYSTIGYISPMEFEMEFERQAGLA
jgi:hypothetical protein